MKRLKGFTLIEMMLVVGIIALLTAIILPRFTNYSTKAQTEALNAQMKNINTQIELYKVDKGSYPASLAASDWTDFSTYWPNGIPSPNVTGKRWVYDATKGVITGITN